MAAGQMFTKRTWIQISEQLRDEFRKWKVEEFRIPPVKEVDRLGAVEVQFVPPGQERWEKVKCDEWGPHNLGHGYTPNWKEYNLLAIVQAIEATRLMDQRGIAGVLAQAVAYKALPSGIQLPERRRDPYEVLGVRADSPKEVIKGAYRALAKLYHPESGGEQANAEKLKEVIAAAEQLGVKG